MRNVPASIALQFAGDMATLARCVKIRLRDGTELFFSDHDEDLLIDLGDGSYEATYTGDAGIISGDLELMVGLDSSNIEFDLPLSADITRAKVLGRRFNQATVWIFDVDWTAETPVPMALMKGWIAESWVKGQKAVFEVRSMQDVYNLTIGRILSPRCTATFGDGQCGVTKTEYPAIVTSADSSMEFEVNIAGLYSDGFFKYGEAEFLDGPLSGTWPFEIYDYTNSTGLVTTLVPMPEVPNVGAGLTLRRGCSNLKKTTDASIPTCFTYNNVLRFRGFDQVPSSDVYLRVPVPGANGA